ncbi:hypothetical protein BDN70DRAFT_937131 [Pholiota conissans]|uniref:Uncharacterized protein n=1 Tax=Pholiota conissans TaxID=109636 RepID=A0A9P5YQZ6_9AGAR|nr:hypothetical protein BDN70DRAFT_937131 [Pholiota conissans]
MRSTLLAPYHHLLVVLFYSLQMIHSIFSDFQGQMAHGIAKIHELDSSTGTTDEEKLDTRSENIGKKGKRHL